REVGLQIGVGGGESNGIVEEDILAAKTRKESRLALGANDVVRGDASAAIHRATGVGLAHLVAGQFRVDRPLRVVIFQLCVEEIVVEIGVVALDQATG